MNRRSFLKFLGIGTAGAAAIGLTPSMLEGFVPDPEALLWMPGEKTILMPPEKTFSLYSADDLRALERAMGVIRFYDTRGGLRLDAFESRNPHEVDKLGALSNQEIRLAIETGYDLDPAATVRRGGAYDPANGRGGRMYTDRGHMVTGPHGRYATETALNASGRMPPWLADTSQNRAAAHRHGQSLLTPAGDRYRSVVTTERTDAGLVVIGHYDRKGP